MFKLDRRFFFSPLGIFIVYTLASCVLIMAFQYILPPEPPPLRHFSHAWRINQGFLTVLNLFPALALSALVIPFGFRSMVGEGLPAFSPRFLAKIRPSIITAIAAAAVYGLLFFLLLPLTRDREDTLRSQGRLFYLAKERAQEHAAAEDWPQAIQFVNICERIWPHSPEMESLRVQSTIGIEAYRAGRGELTAEGRQTLAALPQAAYSGIPGERTPVNAPEALAMAEASLREKRYYDAHWLASLAGRLARQGSIEAVAAARLAGEAWTALSAQNPNSKETQAWSLYRLKREGYEAMVSEEWIRAYYLFRDHAALSPGDPDVVHFLTLCEKGITGVAFFIDEIELAVGEILSGAVFSLPAETEPGKTGGRVALRIASLSTFLDFSYGLGIELIAFDRDEQFLYRLEAPYAKIVPMTLDTGPRLLLQMRALDRFDRNKHWEPAYSEENPQRGTQADSAQLLLSLSYEDFLILSNIRRGPDTLELVELFDAEKKLAPYGYLPQVFQGEIIYRLCEPVLFLPITILTILAGWRFRTQSNPRYFRVLMLGILPLGFDGIIHFTRSVLNNLAIWTTASFGYSAALGLFISGTIILFILSLILLSAQHG